MQRGEKLVCLLLRIAQLVIKIGGRGSWLLYDWLILSHPLRVVYVQQSGSFDEVSLQGKEAFLSIDQIVESLVSQGQVNVGLCWDLDGVRRQGWLTHLF